MGCLCINPPLTARAEILRMKKLKTKNKFFRDENRELKIAVLYPREQGIESCFPFIDKRGNIWEFKIPNGRGIKKVTVEYADKKR